MTDTPTVAPGTWIRVGKNASVEAVVCSVRTPESVTQSGLLEVVYLDHRDRAINEDVRWDGEHWLFVHEGPSGGYADGHARLQRFVQLLRLGRG